MQRARARITLCLLFATIALTTSCALGPQEPEWRQQQDTLRISRPPKTLTMQQESPFTAVVAR